MKVPVSWLREYVTFDLPVEELARRLVFTSCEVDRIVPRGVPDTDGNLGRFVVGQGARGREAPERRPAPALPGRRGGGQRAPDRVRRLELRGRRDGGRGAARARRSRAGSSSNSARCAASCRDGMILAEDEIDLGTDHTGIMLLDAGARSGHAARRRAATHGHRAGDRDGLQPARPDERLRHCPRGVGAPGHRPGAAARARSRARRATSRWTSASRISSAARATSGGRSMTCRWASRRPG